MVSVFPADIAEARSLAKEILLARSVRLGGPFTLASGKTSDFYVDVKQTSLHPQGAAAIGTLIAAAVAGIEFDAIGGPTLGADPLTTAASLALLATGREKPGYIVRKEPKGHGTGAWIEGAGNLPEGCPVVLLEDVVTTGGSGLKAARHVEDAGYRIAACVCVVDREEGGREAVEAAGYQFLPLFTRTELTAG